VSEAPARKTRLPTYRLSEVADALPPTGPRHTIVVVGGSLLALRGLRQSTLDVDTVARIETELADAVAAVARVHDLAPAWLNDASAPFRPQTFVQADCEVLLDRPRLLVLGAPLRQVFMMKLFAARVRTRDYDDLVALWPECGFDSAEEAVELYRDPYRTRRRTYTWSSTSGASPTDASTCTTSHEKDPKSATMKTCLAANPAKPAHNARHLPTSPHLAAVLTCGPPLRNR
jgi:hypothetical protein